MFRKSRFLVVFLMIFSFVICSKDNNPVQTETPESGLPRELSNSETELISASENFGLKLFKEIVNQDPDKNIFISPLSASMALGMTLNGANGQTEADMKSTLEFANLTQEEINSAYKSLIELLLGLDPKVTVELANSIWCLENFPFEQEFKDVNIFYFDAEIRNLDFGLPEAVDIINGWVENKTHNKIRDILDSIPPSAVMYLINAIYFNGTWTYQFDPQNTQEADFFLPDGNTKTCNMMSMRTDLGYAENELFQAVNLPYGDGNFCMTILLPAENITVDELISQFSRTNWDTWMSSFSENDIQISLPKFELEYKLLMNDVLKSLGMSIAFIPGADFTGMYRGGGLWIGRVIHQAFVDVNEEGTEAAASTVVEMKYIGVGPLNMTINRPFVFTIRETNSGTILFIGKVVDPAL